jgi:hypothetical protein
MDVHQYHCNTELYETKGDKEANMGLERIHKDDPNTGTLGANHIFSRVSFVCYLREKLRDCDLNETRKYFELIGFNPKNNTYKHKKRVVNKTRKISGQKEKAS